MPLPEAENVGIRMGREVKEDGGPRAGWQIDEKRVRRRREKTGATMLKRENGKAPRAA